MREQGSLAVAGVVVSHQIANAQTSQAAVGEMLAEQGIDEAADAVLNLLNFTTAADVLDSMLAEIDKQAEDLLDRTRIPQFREQSFDRLVDSIVQDAARAAESVSIAVRPDIYHVRFLSPPSCGRCAILAGRVYRWSTGFERHPGCDCVMIPTTVASPFVQDVDQLVADGQVTGLSKADRQAIRDGADLGQVVNVRRRAAGLREPGRALARNGKPTPEGIYRIASDRDEAVALLRRFGYVR